MKIRLVAAAERDPNGGVAGSTLNLAAALRHHGHDALPLFWDDLTRGATKNKRNELLFAALLAKRLGPAAIDVVDVASGDLWAIALSSRLRLAFRESALVARSHGLEHLAHLERLERARLGDLKLSWRYPIYHGGWRLREVAWSIRNADLALFLNARDRDYAVNQLGVGRDHVAIVDNGLPDSFLGLPLLKPHEPANVAIIGRFDLGKGAEHAVPSLTSLMDRHTKLRAGLFGVGVPPAVVRERFPPRLWSRIEVVERYANDSLPVLLRDYGIQVFPSLADGFGLTALEGMACGLAVIVTTASGIADRLTQGEDALLIPPGSAQAIEDAVERLLADPGLLTRIRRGGHATAQRFSWARIARETLVLYQEALDRKRAQRWP